MYPELNTPSFLMKQILPEDQDFIFQGLSHPQVIPYYGVHYKTFEESKAQMDFYDRLWKERTGMWWKIIDRLTSKPTGACGINAYESKHEKAELGYWLLPEYWRMGIMQEVLPVMINYVFMHWNLNRLEAMIEEGNVISCKLAERMGFLLEGKMRESELKNGQRINMLIYSLLASDRKGK